MTCLSRYDSPAPVAYALRRLFSLLNTPSSSRNVFDGSEVAGALLQSSQTRRSILDSDQQDAQEFFILLLAAVLDEWKSIEKRISEEEEAQNGLTVLQESICRLALTVRGPIVDSGMCRMLRVLWNLI